MIRASSLRRSMLCLHYHMSPKIPNVRALSTQAPAKQWLDIHKNAPQAGPVMPPNLPTRQRRIIYRSRNRGWLELDILFGGWAAKHVPTMNQHQVTAVEHLLEAATPDVLRWVMAQEAPPPEYDNDIIHSLRAYATGEGLVARR